MATLRTTFADRAEFFDSIVSDPTMNRAAIAVAWRLVNHINDKTQECYLSVETMACHLSINEKTVRRGIERLIGAGWFRKEWRRRGGTQYYANYEHRLNMRTKESAKGETVMRTEPAKYADKTSGKMRTDLPTKPKEPINPSRAREAGQADKPPASARDGGVDQQAMIAEYKDMLPKIREAIGDEAFGIIRKDMWRVCEVGTKDRLILAQPTVFLQAETEKHRHAIAKATGMDVEVIKRERPLPAAAAQTLAARAR